MTVMVMSDFGVVGDVELGVDEVNVVRSDFTDVSDVCD